MADEVAAPRPSPLAAVRAHLAGVLRRPLVVVGLTLLLVSVLFPKVGPKDLTVTTLLPTQACGRVLVLSVFDGETLARRHTEQLAGAHELTTALDLPKGEYRLRAEVDCGDRPVFGPTALGDQTVVLDESRALELDLSGLCPCLKR